MVICILITKYGSFHIDYKMWSFAYWLRLVVCCFVLGTVKWTYVSNSNATNCQLTWQWVFLITFYIVISFTFNFCHIVQFHILTCPNSQSLNCLNLLLYHIKMCSCQKAPLSYFSFQPVLHDWFNKSHGIYYPVCGMMPIKEPLLLIGKSSLCGGSGFPLSLSEWSFTICVMPYNRK